MLSLDSLWIQVFFNVTWLMDGWLRVKYSTWRLQAIHASWYASWWCESIWNLIIRCFQLGNSKLVKFQIQIVKITIVTDFYSLVYRTLWNRLTSVMECTLRFNLSFYLVFLFNDLVAIHSSFGNTIIYIVLFSIISSKITLVNDFTAVLIEFFLSARTGSKMT